MQIDSTPPQEKLITIVEKVLSRDGFTAYFATLNETGEVSFLDSIYGPKIEMFQTGYHLSVHPSSLRLWSNVRPKLKSKAGPNDL